jgi:hypothetical protein
MIDIAGKDQLEKIKAINPVLAKIYADAEWKHEYSPENPNYGCGSREFPARLWINILNRAVTVEKAAYYVGIERARKAYSEGWICVPGNGGNWFHPWLPLNNRDTGALL